MHGGKYNQIMFGLILGYEIEADKSVEEYIKIIMLYIMTDYINCGEIKHKQTVKAGKEMDKVNRNRDVRMKIANHAKRESGYVFYSKSVQF